MTCFKAGAGQVRVEQFMPVGPTTLDLLRTRSAFIKARRSNILAYCGLWLYILVKGLLYVYLSKRFESLFDCLVHICLERLLNCCQFVRNISLENARYWSWVFQEFSEISKCCLYNNISPRYRNTEVLISQSFSHFSPDLWKQTLIRSHIRPICDSFPKTTFVVVGGLVSRPTFP